MRWRTGRSAGRRSRSPRRARSRRPYWRTASPASPTSATCAPSTGWLFPMRDLFPSSPAAPPASRSAQQAAERDWMTRVVNWPSNFSGWWLQSAPAGSSGRTSPVPCRLTTDARLSSSSGRLCNSGIAAPGACWTLNTSACPSDAVASSLSDVLETTGEHLLQRCLTRKACRGILRRSRDRGRKLPPVLRAVIEAVAQVDAPPVDGARTT